MTSLDIEVDSETMKPPVNNEEFVTILKVDNETDPSSFVTVVELEGSKGSSAKWVEPTSREEEVTMYRLPGERLGMGLKFEGGMQAFECVSHVYIQSVAPDSPAARTETTWHGLAEGDEILKIDGRSVNKMTRVDCVTTLKKAPVAIKLYVRHGTPATRNGGAAVQTNGPKNRSARFQPVTASQEEPPPLPAKNASRPSPLVEIRGKPKALEPPAMPPPVPPRKLRVRKESSSPDSSPSVGNPRGPSENSGLETIDVDGSRSGILGMKLPGWEELVLRRSSTEVALPVPCGSYTDLIAEEDKIELLNEYESDDTGSSASTVIERLTSAVTSAHALTSEPAVRTSDKGPIDLSQVLGPFEQLEKEIEVDFAMDSDPLEDVPLVVDPRTIEPPENFKDSNPELPPRSRPMIEELVSETPERWRHMPIKDTCNATNQNNKHYNECSKKGPLNAMEQEKNALNSMSEGTLPDMHLPPKRKITPPPVPPRKLKSVKCMNSQEAVVNSGAITDGGFCDDMEDPMAALTFPIIGNLLQELEQLPEFHGSSTSVSGGGGDDLVAGTSSEESESVNDTRDQASCNSATDSNKQTDLISQDEPLLTHSLALNGLESAETLTTEDQVYPEASPDLNLRSSPPVEATASFGALDAEINSESIASNKSKTVILDSERVQCSDEEEVAGGDPAPTPGSCEVVAVIEKLSHAKHVTGHLDSDKSTMASDSTSSTYSEDAFISALSRLPPDGHEFPSNYLESDGMLNGPSLVVMNSDLSDKDFVHFEKPWIQPPVGFEDFQSCMLSNGSTKEVRRSSLRLTMSEVLDDASTASSRSSDTGDTVIYSDHPPPMPSMDLCSYSSSDGEVFSGDEAPEEILLESIRETTASREPVVKRTPPVPPKRHLPGVKAPPLPPAKVEESLLSVKDKIALFVAKTTELAQTVAPLSPPKPQATRRSLPIEKPIIDSHDGISSEAPLRGHLGTETAEEGATVKGQSDEAPLLTSCNLSVNDYIHDRSGSSLSMSSSFSKSSDDLLSQDMDNSDVDDHAPTAVQSHPYTTKATLAASPRPNGQDSRGSRSYWSTSSTDSDATESRSSSRNRSMYSILETRKQNVSKLKGLVIPQVQEAPQCPVAAAPELPLIFSVDSILLPKVELTKAAVAKPPLASSHSPDLPTMPRTSLTSNGTLEMPKYSPAFKRKPFTVVQEVMLKPSSDEPDNVRSRPAAPPVSGNDWLDTSPPPLPKSLPPLPKGRSSAPFSHQMDLTTLKNTEDIATTGHLVDSLVADTEDQESGISSIESPNVSIHNTPPGSPKGFHHSKLAYVSTSPELTTSLESMPPKSSEWETNSSSAESETSTDPRILKANSVEAINRKNVLQSSRHSSGGFDEVDLTPNDQSDGQFDFKAYATLSSSGSTLPKDTRHNRKISLEERSTTYKLDTNLARKDVKNDQDVSKIVMTTESPKIVSDERWLELERKYGPKNGPEPGKLNPFHKSCSEEGLLDKVSNVSGDVRQGNNSGRNFRALAERWEQRSIESLASQPSMKTSSALSKSLTSIIPNGNAVKPVSSVQLSTPEKKPSIYTNVGVTMRDKSISLIARPVSLLDTEARKSKLWEVAFENGPKTGRGTIESSIHYGKPRSSASLPSDVVNGKSRRSTSFNDLRQIFENQEMSLPSPKGGMPVDGHPSAKDLANHMRMSSLDSTCSESDFGPPAHYGSATSLGSNPIDHYGSITSLASSTSLISPQELQQLIDEANQSLEESGTPSHEITVVVLQREIPGGSIGITLAGGADYDSKEITVNKVITGSLADRDGRIQKGDRVLSINGKNLKGVTHREALLILKAPRTDCVLVLSRSRSSSPQDGKENGTLISRTANANFRNRVSRLPSLQQAAPPPVLSVTADVTKSKVTPLLNGSSLSPSTPSSSVVTMELVKDVSGLGFSLDGGKDSPQGDKPLTIKKIFLGGAAHKHGLLHVGDEVLSINHVDVTKMSRIEAWSYMRKLPDGAVQVMVSHAK